MFYPCFPKIKFLKSAVLMRVNLFNQRYYAKRQ
jgi:hypothetical protein